MVKYSEMRTVFLPVKFWFNYNKLFKIKYQNKNHYDFYPILFVASKNNHIVKHCNDFETIRRTKCKN